MFNMFGAKPFGTPFDASTSFTQIATSGTTVKFNPPNGQDTIVKNGVTTNINTKHQCITAMKEYENKSIEELRLEYYAANRNGKQQKAGRFLFGTTPATQTTGFNFGGAGSGTGFGASAGFGTSTGTSLFGQQQSTGLFGQQNKTAFGTTTAANTGLGFGTNTSTGTSLFGQQQKPQYDDEDDEDDGDDDDDTDEVELDADIIGDRDSVKETGLFAQKIPAFGTSTAGSTGFSFNAGSSQESSNLFAKSLPNNTFTGFNTASTATTGFDFAATGNAASTGGALFGGAQSSGSPLFGQPSASSGFTQIATSGTTVKFNPPNGQDTIVKNGVTININTKHQCITAMKEYENKSIEELRLEYYAANRNGKQQKAGGFLFGTTPATQTKGFNFGGAGSGTGFGATAGFGTSAGTSLFGQQQSTGLFGQQNKTAFGTTTAANTGLGFGTNTSTGTSLFGQQQKPQYDDEDDEDDGDDDDDTDEVELDADIIGDRDSVKETGLFAQKIPAFGTSTAGSTGFSFNAGSSQESSNLFAKSLPNNTFTGFNTASTATTGFDFAATGNAASTGGALFGGAQSSGSPLFGQPSASSGFTQIATSGTTVKFNPPNGQDTIVKNGVTTNINTKHQCITAMKEYENKSIEELRLEYYAANRNGKQQKAGGFLFGTTPATQTTGFNFGGAGSGTGFGATAGFGTSTGTSLFGQQQSTGLFGQQNKTAFATTTAANTGLGFGTNTSTGTSLFGQQQKPQYDDEDDEDDGDDDDDTDEVELDADIIGDRDSVKETGLFAQKIPAFGTSTAGSTGFSFNAGSSQGSSNLFAKPLPNSTFTGFNTASTTTTGFGGNTSTFTAKTTGTSAGFATPGFGSNTPAPTGGFFGQNTSLSTATGLFGGGQQTTTFGGNPNSSFAFGSTPSASGGLLGQNNQSTGAGLFATPVSNTAFGAKTPGFSGFSATGNAASTGGALFGGAQSSGSSLFGQPSASSGFTQTATSGTTVKFNPPNGQDTIVKNGVLTNINTKHQCITAMKEYENKSIEELRLEDYLANQKDKQQQTGGTIFGTTSATRTKGFNFGHAGCGTGFGTSGGFANSTGTLAFGQQQKQATNLFCQQNKLSLGTTTTSSAFGLGTSSKTVTSLFGKPQKLNSLLRKKPPSIGTSAIRSTGSKGVSQESSNFFYNSLVNTFSSSSTATTSTHRFESTTKEIKPKCMDVGSQTDFSESTVAESKPKCMDAGSQTDFGYFARELIEQFKSKENPDPIQDKGHTNMISSGIPSMDGTLHPSIIKNKQLVMSRPSSFEACEVCTHSFASLSVMPNNSSLDSQGTENKANVANITTEQFGSQTLVAFPKATTQDGVAAGTIPSFTPTVTTQWIFSKTGTSSVLSTTLGGLPAATASPSGGTTTSLSRLSIFGSLPITTAPGGLPTATASSSGGTITNLSRLSIFGSLPITTAPGGLPTATASPSGGTITNLSRLSIFGSLPITTAPGGLPTNTSDLQKKKIGKAVRKIRR